MERSCRWKDPEESYRAPEPEGYPAYSRRGNRKRPAAWALAQLPELRYQLPGHRQLLDGPPPHVSLHQTLRWETAVDKSPVSDEHRVLAVPVFPARRVGR